ncbi:ZPR1 zinc finger domain-containing protein [Candidatus Woesearchaeota archaeon]|nr:ZPR1 zinc finger domain-containing protein [Candidatus Woesearchaeota archaeon]
MAEEETHATQATPATQADILKGEMCPFCHKPNLTLREEEVEVPYFGRVFLFSMNCSNCKYHKSDVECAEQKPPCKYTFDVDCEDDLKVRVVRSAEGVIKIPRIGSIEPGEAANGFVTNVEGVLQRMKDQVERLRDEEEDEELKKKARNMAKKLGKVMWGQEKCKIIIEDPSGNSAIISEKAVKGKL